MPASCFLINLLTYYKLYIGDNTFRKHTNFNDCDKSLKSNVIRKSSIYKILESVILIKCVICVICVNIDYR